MRHRVIIARGLIGLDATDLPRRCSIIPIGAFQDPADVARANPETKGLLVLLSHRIDAGVMDLLPDLEVISNYAVGFDNIDISEATARGVTVTNTPDVLTEATADLTWALLLAAARRIVEADRFMRSGAFRGWQPDLLLGSDIAGRVMGIVGMGRIGRAVARRARGFDMRIIYQDTAPSPGIELEPGTRRVELEELLCTADVVSIHVPLTRETRGLIGEKELAAMKPGAILVNTSRGPVLDERALVESLKCGPVVAAGLDVYEEEPVVVPGLLELDNVVLSPHIGSAGRETRAMMTSIAARNLLAVLDGGDPPHPVNRPERGVGRDRPPA